MDLTIKEVGKTYIFTLEYTKKRWIKYLYYYDEAYPLTRKALCKEMTASLQYKEILEGVKRSHSPLNFLNRHQECNGMQRHDNNSYIWRCYHTITNHAIYV